MHRAGGETYTPSARSIAKRRLRTMRFDTAADARVAFPRLIDAITARIESSRRDVVHPSNTEVLVAQSVLPDIRADRRRRGAMWLVGAASCALALACASPRVRSTVPGTLTAAQLAELWVEPADLGGRDVFHGPGGAAMVPDPSGRWEYVAEDTTGSSRGWDVRDERGTVWDVKLGAEAQPEVVVSRLLWAAGFHQLPTYYVSGWKLTREGAVLPQPPGRFRPKLPTRRKVGEWSWQENPFVDTTQYRGLIVLNLMVNNWDLKTSNNALYALAEPEDGARRWYVVKDVGAALGQTPRLILDGTPNDVALFERQGFVEAVQDGRVRFDYIRPHNELLATVRPADVRWACARLARLTPRQWADAFRAAGYDAAVSARYVRKLQAKVAQGMRLAP